MPRRRAPGRGGLYAVAAGISVVTVLFLLVLLLSAPPGVASADTPAAMRSMAGHRCSGDRSLVYVPRSGSTQSDVTEEPAPALTEVLQSEWDNRHRRGDVVFDASSYKVRTLRGVHNFLVAHNPARAGKRASADGASRLPKKSDASASNLSSPFDGRAFNFLQVPAPERLLLFAPQHSNSSSSNRGSRSSDSASAGHQTPSIPAHYACRAYAAERDAHPVFVNKWPLGPWSGVLAPFVGDQLGQALTLEALLVGLAFALALDDPYMRVGFNSLGAGASVNHMHFQFWHLPHALPIEKTPLVRVFGARVVVAPLRSTVYPIAFLVWPLTAAIAPDVAAQVFACVAALTTMGAPYNIVATAARVFLLPRHSGVPFRSWPVQGFPDVAGALIAQSASDYTAVTETEIVEYFTAVLAVDGRVITELLDVAVAPLIS